MKISPKNLCIRFLVLAMVLAALSPRLPAAAATDQSAPTEEEVLVIYNSAYVTDSDNDLTQDSEQIAEYYQSKRPGVTIHGFAMPTMEEVTWAQYNADIKEPLETYLTGNGLEDTIKIIVTVKGVPLKIMGDPGFHDPWDDPECEPFCPVNFASVDAGITLSYQDFKSTTRHTNPYYNADPTFAENSHFKLNHFTADGFTLRYLVSRLDGYTLADVLGMIDRGTAADTSSDGYWVLDSSSTMNHAPYSITRSYLLSFNKNVLYDPYPGSTYITTSVNPIMGYSSFGYLDGMGDGYVSNDPANPNHFDFDLLNGAVMSTWESYNAWGFQDADQHYHGQIGEWIAIGGSGGIGNVYEPYTSSLARESTWMPAYAVGYPWVEAAYMSMPKMGYAQTVLGDPLMVIADNQEPDPVTDFSATGQDGRIQLAWTNPTDPDLLGVKVLRKSGSYPTSASDGTVVYDGTAASYLNAGLVNGVTYYYAAFAYDTTYNYSDITSGSRATAYAHDDVAPGPVTGLQAVTSTGMANLHWTNPADADFSRTIVMRKNGSYPTSVSDGTQVYAGSGASYLDVGLSSGVAYYYSAFAQDESLNYSALAAGSTLVVSIGSSGGGGGGGGGSPAPSPIPEPVSCSLAIYSEWSSCSAGTQFRSVLTRLPNSCVLTAAQASELTRACAPNPTQVPGDTVTAAGLLDGIRQESQHVDLNNFTAADEQKRAAARIRYAGILGKIDSTESEKFLNFISCGTGSTAKLGEGERAGVLNSYIRAYGHLPADQEEWFDVLKIAHGRWPGERRFDVERAAVERFEKIYGRGPSIENASDNNAIMVMAYGLLPAQRNLTSEKSAIRSFRWVYGRPPKSAEDWNAVRAIAYSGSRR